MRYASGRFETLPYMSSCPYSPRGASRRARIAPNANTSASMPHAVTPGTASVDCTVVVAVAVLFDDAGSVELAATVT